MTSTGRVKISFPICFCCILRSYLDDWLHCGKLKAREIEIAATLHSSTPRLVSGCLPEVNMADGSFSADVHHFSRENINAGLIWQGKHCRNILNWLIRLLEQKPWRQRLFSSWAIIDRISKHLLNTKVSGRNGCRVNYFLTIPSLSIGLGMNSIFFSFISDCFRSLFEIGGYNASCWRVPQDCRQVHVAIEMTLKSRKVSFSLLTSFVVDMLQLPWFAWISLPHF